MLINKKKYMI